jgi:hypothetical protein
VNPDVFGWFTIRGKFSPVGGDTEALRRVLIEMHHASMARYGLSVAQALCKRKMRLVNLPPSLVRCLENEENGDIGFVALGGVDGVIEQTREHEVAARAWAAGHVNEIEWI